jgi:hypothetical protein
MIELSALGVSTFEMVKKEDKKQIQTIRIIVK